MDDLTDLANGAGALEGSSGLAAGIAPEGEGASPQVTLGGFHGPLDLLLTQARAHRIDLATLQIRDLVDQLAERLQHASLQTPLGRKADWVVMASWILLLRSDLLLPADTSAHHAAERQAGQLRGRLVALQEIQALAAWLDRQPQLGRDVFARGQPGSAAGPAGAPPEIDVIGFLWACLDQFEDPADVVATRPVYRLAVLDLYPVAEARARILRLLAESGTARTLAQLLPMAADDGTAAPPSRLRRRSAWTSTFLAGLELTKQGELALVQDDSFSPIHVSLVN